MQIFHALAYLAEPATRHPHGLIRIFRHLGGLGLFIVSVMDGSPIPAFAGPDILTAILSTRQREPWYYYTVIATAGSLIGAYITFRIARRAGVGYLHRKFGERKTGPLLKFFSKWGTGTLMVTAVLPVPFPTTAVVAVAGVVDYPLRTFLLVMGLCRAVRYGAIAIIASHYGRRFIIALRHPLRYSGWLLAITAAVIMVSAALLILTRHIVAHHAEMKTTAS